MTTQELQGIADRVLPGTTVTDPDSFLAFLEDQGRRVASGQQVAQLAVEQEDRGDGGFLGFLTRSLVDEDVLDTIRDQGFFGRIGANVLGELTNPIGIASTALLATGVGAPLGVGLRAATAGTRLAGLGRLGSAALTPAAQSARGLSAGQIVTRPGILGRSLATEAAVTGGAIAGGGVAQEAGQIVPGPTRSTPGQIALGLAGGVVGGGATAGGINRVLDEQAVRQRSFEVADPIEEQIPEIAQLRTNFREAVRSEVDIASQRARGRSAQFQEGARAAAGIEDPFERAQAFRAAGGGEFVDRNIFEPLGTSTATRGNLPNLSGPVTERGRELGVTPELFSKLGGNIDELYGSNTAVGNRALEAFSRLMLGEVPAPAERNLLRPIIGNAFVNQLDAVTSTRGSRAVRLALEVAGIPRAFAGSFDVSSVLRQGGPLNISHPRVALKAWRTGFKALRNEKYALEVNQQHINDPDVTFLNTGLDEQDQLFLHTLGESALARREEQYISPLIQNVPGIKQSEQFFATNLNSTRVGLVKQRLKTLRDQHPELLQPENALRLNEWRKRVAHQINVLTGRGSLGFLENPRGSRQGQARFVRDALSVSFWSPRLLVSRFQSLQEAIRAAGGSFRADDPAIRTLSREMARDIATYVGGVSATIGALSLLPGVSVNVDPRSSDFGKVRLGDTRIDPWAGFQQIGRYGTQFALGQRTRASDGETGPVARDRILGQFLRSKLAPGLPSLTASDLPNDFLLSGLTGGGENFIGEPITGGDVTPGAGARSLSLGTADQLPAELNVVVDQMVPLLAQDIAEALESEGLVPTSAAAFGSAFGLGSTTFGEGTQSEFVRGQQDAGRGQDPRVAVANAAFR